MSRLALIRSFAVATLLGTLGLLRYCPRPSRSGVLLPTRGRRQAAGTLRQALRIHTPRQQDLAGRVLPWCPLAIRSAAIRAHVGDAARANPAA